VDELRQIETRWMTWAACLHEAGHVVAAIATGRRMAGAYVAGPSRAYSRCESSPTVYAAGDIAVKLRSDMGTQPPDGAPHYFEDLAPEIPVDDAAGARMPTEGTPGTTPDRVTLATVREIEAEAESILRANWLPLVEIASELFKRGFITEAAARRFMGGASGL
jgi:hypothetical protein